MAFRETIEVMHADGLRVFVDVGARGNLAAFVEDILRGKPAFAVAANLPRRGGQTQLNHLVAATFAQGASVRADYLYARRRPRAIDWSTAEAPPRPGAELRVGFPEMKVSDALVSRLRSRSRSQPAAMPLPHDPDVPAASFPLGVEHQPSSCDVTANGAGLRQESAAPGVSILAHSEQRFTMLERGELEPSADAWGLGDDHEEGSPAPEARGTEDAMVAFQETMRAFLETQQAVLNAYLVPTAAGAGAGASVEFAEAIAVFETDGRVPGGSVPERHCSPMGAADFAPPAAHLPGVAPLGEWVDGSHPAVGDGDHLQKPLATGPAPGPWVGEVRRLVRGNEIETVFILDRRDDPIAEHHTLGGRKISALDPSLRGLPVLPFAVMAEMCAQVAALVVSPGLVLTTLVQVRAHKWVRYEEVPIQLELRGKSEPSSGDERVWVGIFNRGPGGENEAARPVFEAIAVFGASIPEPQPAAPWSLAQPQVSRFTAETLYGEGWLFHGPPFQALVEVGQYSEEGIDGMLRVLPWQPLLRQGQRAALHTDLIVIDSFTHLLGCWGLDFLKEGDIVYPLRLEALELYGDRPPVGSEVACRIAIQEVQRHRVRVLVEIVRPDGTLWIRIRDWEDWRFHWPSRYRDVFRQPQDFFVGEEIVLDDPARGPVGQARCVWLEPPADMGRPVWRDVLEAIQLGPAERTAFLASCGPDRRRSHKLWGRIAAKEAARRLWQAEGLPATYPADLAIVADPVRRPFLVRVEDPEDRSLPAISIAHADGVALALAASEPSARVGIDVETIADRPPGFEESAFTPAERALLSRWTGASRAEWVARFWCAKEAAAKASGVGLAAGPTSAEVVWLTEDSGEMHVRLATELLAACSERIESPLRIVSARRGSYAWAWTLGEGAEL